MKCIFLIISVLFINIANAKTVEVSATRILASNKTTDQLNDELKSDLKELAISKMPSYVEHVQYLESGNDGDRLNEKITSLNAGLVTLSNVKVKWINSERGLLLEMSAIADVDLNVLDVQIANVRRNRAMEDNIKLAAKELESLQKQIDSFDAELLGKGEHGDRQKLSKIREHLITKILSSADTSTVYEISNETKKRLLISHDLFANKRNAFEQGHAVGENIYYYLEKHLVVSLPKLSVKGNNQLDVAFNYGFDPIPVVGILEKYYKIEMKDDYFTLVPLFSEGSYEGVVTKVINNYLFIKVGVKVSTINEWKHLRVVSNKMKHKNKFNAPFRIYFGHGSNDKSKNGNVILSMSLTSDLVSNPVGLTVGKSI